MSAKERAQRFGDEIIAAADLFVVAWPTTQEQRLGEHTRAEFPTLAAAMEARRARGCDHWKRPGLIYAVNTRNSTGVLVDEGYLARSRAPITRPTRRDPITRPTRRDPT